MSETNVDLSLLSQPIQNMMTELRLVRKDCSDARQLALQSYELSKRRERGEMELRDDLEMILKIELGGTMANLQTSIDAAVARIEDRFSHVDERLQALERKP